MKNINKYLKSGIVLGALVYSVGTNIPTQTTYADEINTETVVKEWRPEGKVIAQGEDGVPWELYENGYLLFKPEPGKNTLSNENVSWKNPEYGEKTKAIGFTDKVYLPENSGGLFSNVPGSLTLAEFLDTSKIDTSKVKNMSNLFYYTKLKEINLDTWDTSNVTDMTTMFLGSSGVEKLNISNLNTKNVTSMNGMFSNLEGSGFKDLDLSKWDTSNVTDINRMFTLNYSTEKINVSNWDTSKITTMVDTFAGVHSLKEIKGIENWNTSNVKKINGIFSFSENLKSLNLGKWNTSNIENIDSAFLGAEGLTYLNIENWDTSKVESFGEAVFHGTSLTHLKIGNKFAKTKLTDNLFKSLDEFDGYDSNIVKKHNYKWTRLDKTTPFYTVEEWDKVFRENPDKLAGTWVREKNYNGYDIVFETGTDEIIELLEVEIGKDFELPVPTRVKEGYHFVGWSKTQDGEIIKDKTNLGKKNETVTLYAKWEKNPPVSTNTPTEENGNLILPPTVNELPEYKGGTNPADAPINEKPEYNGGVNSIEPPVNEKPEYTSPLSTNTPVDDNGKLVLPPIVDKLPEYKEPTLEIPDLNTNKEIIKSEIPKEETSKERELPNTNSGSILASLVSSIIGTLGLGYKKRK